MAIAGALISGQVMAAGEVVSVEVVDQPATPFRYTTDGTEFTWGLGSNQVMTHFSTASDRFGFLDSATRVELQRDDIAGVATGEPCGVFAQQLGDSPQALQPDYPGEASGSGNCDMAAMLASRVMNRGTLDIFSNEQPTQRNIERVDYLFDYGVLAPLNVADLANAGHVVGEKLGNNSVQMAAILDVDVLGQPTRYGPLVFINPVFCESGDVCYGLTNLRHNNAFFQSNPLSPQGLPSYLQTITESLTMAFVSTEKLGLQPGQRYYGMSFFGPDVDASTHVLTDPTSFPDDTHDESVNVGDSADIYGGVSGYFAADRISVGSGAVFIDLNGDGVKDENEAGVSDIGVQLVLDSNGNGVYDPGVDEVVGDSIDSNISGSFVLPGLPNGNFFLVLDESDPEIPPGLELPAGTNPLNFQVSSSDVDGLNFGFAGGGDPNAPGGPDDPNNPANPGDPDGPSNPDGPGNPGGPDGPGNPGDPNNPGGPDEPSNPGGPNNPGGPDEPGNPGDPNNPGGPDEPGNPGGPNNPGGPDEPGNPGDPNNPGGPDEPGNPGGPNNPGGPDEPGNPGDPNNPGSPDGPSNPGDPNNPGSPDEPGNPGGPNNPGGPDGPSNPGGPNNPGGPDEPGNPGDPNNPGGPDEPGNPGDPNNPGGPDEPGTPGGPDQPGNDPTQLSADPDMVTVQQGSAITIDVLENDSGTNLMVMSVSESLNATIEIVNNEVVYTPNFNFFGTDTFVYSIEDAGGNTDSSQVTVDVTRFSDINGNGLNDFDECNCDSLILETGIHGFGVAGGRVGPALLALLLAWAAMRVSRRRPGRRQLPGAR